MACTPGLCLAQLLNLGCLALGVVLFTWFAKHEYLEFQEQSDSTKAAAFQNSPMSYHKATVTSYGIEYTGTCSSSHGWGSQKGVESCTTSQESLPACTNMSNSEIPQPPLGQPVARRLSKCHDAYVPWAQVSYQSQQNGISVQLTRCAYPYGTYKNSKGLSWDDAKAAWMEVGLSTDDGAIANSELKLSIWVFDAVTNCVVGVSSLKGFVAYEQSKAWGSLPGLLATFGMMCIAWGAFCGTLYRSIQALIGTGLYEQTENPSE